MRIFKDIINLLIFRITREELLRLNSKHLIIGLIGTWLVGMGRYWDDPNAHLLQHLGVGSLIYIFALSLFIWLILKPYFVEHWRYINVLTFISLTSFPAIFYAIPVERFYSMETAASLNVWFLAIVATWRFVLLFFYLTRYTLLQYGYIIIATLLPVCVIIAALMLNLERAVFELMGGIRDSTSNDRAYVVLIVLTFISSIAALPLLLAYGIAIHRRWNITANKSKN